MTSRLNILPKDVQQLVWKCVFQNTIKDLHQRVKYIRINFENTFGCNINIKNMERIQYYDYFRFTENDWGLLLGSGRKLVSNKEAIDNFLWR